MVAEARAASDVRAHTEISSLGIVRANVVISEPPLVQGEPRTGRKDCSGRPIRDSPFLDGSARGRILSRGDFRIYLYSLTEKNGNNVPIVFRTERRVP